MSPRLLTDRLRTGAPSAAADDDRRANVNDRRPRTAAGLPGNRPSKYQSNGRTKRRGHREEMSPVRESAPQRPARSPQSAPYRPQRTAPPGETSSSMFRPKTPWLFHEHL